MGSLPMVIVPGGEYEMGDHHDMRPPALPVHTVRVDPFYIGRFEVTNAQYADSLNWALAHGLVEVDVQGVVRGTGNGIAYCDTTLSSSYSRITWSGSTFGVVAGKESHPMLMVNWYGAAAFANWRSVQEGRLPCYDTTTWACDFAANGYRLPTEAEWEFAARGGQDSPYYRYPWGDTLDGSRSNYNGSGDPFELEGWPQTTPVGYFDGHQVPPGPNMANLYGIHDLSGNAFEFCNDWYAVDYYGSSPYDNPRGPVSGVNRVIRGGSWYSVVTDPAALVSQPPSCSYRDDGYDPAVLHAALGFRLALVHDVFDCNDNGVLDASDLSAGTSNDCNGNDIPDECDLATTEGSLRVASGSTNSCGGVDIGTFVVSDCSGTPQPALISGGNVAPQCDCSTSAFAGDPDLLPVTTACASDAWGVFTTTFFLDSGFSEPHMVLTIRADDGAEIALNNVLVDTVDLEPVQGEQYVTHSIEVTDPALFVVGENTLELYVVNTGTGHFGVPAGRGGSGDCMYVQYEAAVTYSALPVSDDCNTNSVPDECEPDFDGDGLIDDCDGDIDNDGILNALDVCDHTPTSLFPELIEQDGSVLGDLDGDCDVDLVDYAIMQERFTGPN